MLFVPLLWLALTLLHVNYVTLGWQLGWKHWHLGRAEAALLRGDRKGATREAGAALALDARSALARVALARAALLAGQPEAALALLDQALVAIPDHPLAHVVRGDLRRSLGDDNGARLDLAFETATQQDLQAWGWAQFMTPAPARLDLGDGLDLGFVRGFHLPRAGEAGFRWTRDRAALRLAAPQGARELVLRLASGRPDGGSARVEVLVNGAPAGSFTVAADWQEIAVPLPEVGGELLVELRAPTFRSRQFDPASPDGRVLGVRVALAEAR